MRQPIFSQSFVDAMSIVDQDRLSVRLFDGLDISVIIIHWLISNSKPPQVRFYKSKIEAERDFDKLTFDYDEDAE